jgi:hypothetical protein
VGERERPLRDLLPRWAFFTDDARYGLGETPVQASFKSVVEDLMRGSPLAEQVETTANDALQVELDGLFEHLSKLTTQVKGICATADVDWKKAVGGIDVTWLDSFGSRVPYELRGASAASSLRALV